MGLYFGMRSSCGERPMPGNPVPNRYRIHKVQAVGKHLVAMIHYPDAINFEGDKILLFEDMEIEDLYKLKSIDPHFRKDCKLIARFRPTRKGWELAKATAKLLCG